MQAFLEFRARRSRVTWIDSGDAGCLPRINSAFMSGGNDDQEDDEDEDGEDDEDHDQGDDDGEEDDGEAGRSLRVAMRRSRC